MPTPKQAEVKNVAKSRPKPKPKRRWAKLPTGMYGWTTSRGEGASLMKRMAVCIRSWGIRKSHWKEKQVTILKILSLDGWALGKI